MDTRGNGNSTPSSSWICSCSYMNPGQSQKCEVCDEPYCPQSPSPTSGISSKSRSHQEPIQLFMKGANQQLFLNSEALNILQKNFNCEQKIVLLVATGMLGTGKSTWLSSMIYESEKPNVRGSFKTGYTQQTETEGLWVYPYPLRYSSSQDPSIQFMLLDMEGMGGVYGDNQQDKANKTLTKLFTLSLLLSSVFTIHTNFRIDQTTLEHLQQAEMIFLHIKNVTKLEPPKIFILSMDTEKLVLRNPHENASDFFLKSLKLSPEFEPLVDFQGRPGYPEGFLSNLKKNGKFASLENSEIQKFNQRLIKASLPFIKKMPGLAKAMKIDDFINFTKDLAAIINSENYEELFTASLQTTLESLLQPMFVILIEEFNTQSEALASNFPPTSSEEDFKQEIDKLRVKARTQLDQVLKDKLTIKYSDFDILKKGKQRFEISLKNEQALRSFILRKMEHASKEERERFEGMLQEMAKVQKEKDQINKGLQDQQEAKMRELETMIQKGTESQEKLQASLAAAQTEIENGKRELKNAQESKNSEGGGFTFGKLIGKVVDTLFGF